MIPRTRFQHLVARANENLPKLSQAPIEWAFRHTLRHFAFRNAKGQTYCLDCGHQWSESASSKSVICPNCGARLTLQDTRCRKATDKSYFSTLTTKEGLQVQRVFRLTAEYRKGKPAYIWHIEIARYWTDEKGKSAITALKRNMGYYLDNFAFSSDIELRNDSSIYQRVADCEVYPVYSAISILRRNGLKGSLTGITPQKLIEGLIKDSRIETLIKAGRKAELAYFLNAPTALDRCWSALKIAIRQNYRIEDTSLWADYITLLERCGKDTHNAHYVCPINLKAAHDHYNHLAEQIRLKEEREKQRAKALANESRFRELKAKFFGLTFKSGKIEVIVLDSVEAYYDEGTALHHCVGQSEYYLKPNTLVLSARIEGERIETVELSLDTFKVLQSRGLCNKDTPYHKRIINLVQKNAGAIRKRMTA